MAFLLKNSNRQSTNRQPTIEQWIQVTQANQSTGAGLALPASTTGQLFRVRGGRILIHALFATVTTILDASDSVLSWNTKQLDNSSVAVGTAVAIASTVTTANREVGGTFFVEGDGTAMVAANAGCIFIGQQGGEWIMPQGEIYVTTTATRTGAMKYDMWYQPLDAGAFAEPAVLTGGLLTAAI